MSAQPASFEQIRATYRLQFHRGFTFRDATELVPYLSKLGISHIYASPIMEARPGSTHGYDIINHNRLNPELGREEDFREFVDALHRHGMGLILDIVPNHMAIGGCDNAWWLDVLEWGRDSPFAEYFDINWDATRPDLKGRVLLPVLGEQYGVVLENGDIELRFDPEEGSFSAWYFEHRLPISPRAYPSILIAGGEALGEFARAFAELKPPPATARQQAAALKQRLSERASEPAVAGAISAALGHYTGQKGDPEGFRNLHCLLEAQAYRIADWRVAAEEINYRRFFNINHLAGLRVEVPEVFGRTHRLVGELIRRGDVQGLRIDHIDGLFDPRAYCERLQEEFGPLYVLVEKILAHYETLPDWPVAGTTGYDFTNQVIGLFVDPAGERAMTRLYRRIADRREAFRRCALRQQGAHHAGQPRERDERSRPRVSQLVDAGLAHPRLHLERDARCARGGRRRLPSVSHLCIVAGRCLGRRPPLHRVGAWPSKETAACRRYRASSIFSTRS